MKINQSTAAMLLMLGVSANAFAPASTTNAARPTTSLDASIGLYYGTVGGNTKIAANHIKNAAGDEDITLTEIENLKDPSEFTKHDALIIGAPTWNTGADKERTLTGWDQWLYNVLPTLDVKDKKVALFGVGDQSEYPFYCTLLCCYVLFFVIV